MPNAQIIRHVHIICCLDQRQIIYLIIAIISGAACLYDVMLNSQSAALLDLGIACCSLTLMRFTH